MTVVTQFVTDDGTDDGDLVEIRRLYVQDGKAIKNSNANILGPDGGDSITESYCTAQKKKFNDPDDFRKKNGLKQTGEALRRGMTLVLSLWDDFQCQMLWLDSDAGKGGHSTPGVGRGPCPTTSGVPADVRAKYPDASTTYYNIMYGEIGSTYTASKDERPDQITATGLAAAAGGVTAVSGGAVTQPQQQVMQQPQQQISPQQPQQIAQQPVPQAVPAPAPMAGASSGSCSDAFQQCGGDTWTGPTCCQTGCTCTQQGGPSYSQCVPPAGGYMCSGSPQRLFSLREVSAPRADGSETKWATQSAAVLRAGVLALLVTAVAAAAWVRARRIRSSAPLHSEQLNLMSSAD
jgi:cellulose 1,4-beta-cellobiosidase